MSKQDNRIVVDLGKVQYARFYYRNQYDQKRDVAVPNNHFTLHGVQYHKIEQALHCPGVPNETLYERAKRRESVDVWIPVLKLQLQANHSLVYTGTKAKALWKEWGSRVFNKKG